MKDTLQAERGLQSHYPLNDDHIGQLWAADARARRDDVRCGAVATIPGQEALAQVRKSVAQCNHSFDR